MIGKEIGDYRILEKIGQGGMGSVYLALQKSLNRRIALKVMPIDDSISKDAIDRFILEARLTASVDHPNVVTVYNVGQGRDFLYIAMEYVQGVTLGEMMLEGPIPEKSVWEIAYQVGQGLYAALRNEVIHRDVKPANILINESEIAKIADFGISKKLDGPNDMTRVGVILGSPYYLSPEQAGALETDFRADIYSLGATLYQALSGRLLFNEDSVFEILHKHQNDEVVPPQDYKPDLMPESSLILAKMLQKNPEDRYLCYSDFLTDVNALLNSKPLIYARESDACSIYTHKPLDLPGADHSSTMVNISGLDKPVLMIGIVPANQWIKNYDGCAHLNAHPIVSLSEMRAYLVRNPAVVLLDGLFLGIKIIHFCDVLRREFPDSYVAIIAEKNLNPTNASLFASELFIPRSRTQGGYENQLTEFAAKAKTKAGALTLKALLRLGSEAHWTAEVHVDLGAASEGTIRLKQGKIVYARRMNLRGKQALRSLLLTNETWSVGALQVSDATLADEAGAASQFTAVHHSTVELSAAKTLSSSNGMPGVFSNGSGSTQSAAHGDSMHSMGGTQNDSMKNGFLKILVADWDKASSAGLTEVLNNTGRIMAISVNDEDDLFEMLNIDRFDVILSRPGAYSSHRMSFQQEISRIHPDIHQIVLLSEEQEGATLEFMSEGISLIRDKDGISAILRGIYEKRP